LALMEVCVTSKPGLSRRTVKLERGATVGDLFRNLGILLEEYVPLIEGFVVTELEELNPGDRVVLLRTCPGGDEDEFAQV